MPTFGLFEEDLANSVYISSDDCHFRRYIPDSMRHLEKKKFIKEHDTALGLEAEISNKLRISRKKAIQAYEDKKREYDEKFQKSDKKLDSERSVECSEQYVLSLSQAWLEECKHPSSTANISIHEAIEVEDSSNKSQSVTIGKSALDASELNNSVPSHLFDHTNNENVSFVNNSLFAQSVSSPLPISVPIKDFHLDSYNGARPSFAGNIFTSTPQMKKSFKFGGNQLANSPLVEESVFVEKVSTDISRLENCEDSVFVMNEVEKKVESPQRDEQDVGSLYCPLIMYADCLEKKEDNDLASSRFERGNPTLRVKIKRRINDLISVYAKRTVDPSDLRKIVDCFTNLLNGNQTDATLDNLKLDDSDAIAYAIKVIIDYSLNVIIIDKNLITSISTVLVRLSSVSELFEKVLIGRFFSSSHLLTLDTEKCASFVSKLKSLPADAKSSVINEEKSTVKLFFSLFIEGSTLLSLKNLWSILAFVLNTSHIVLATVIIVNSILEVKTVFDCDQ
ncbi:unnamed protein product [Auanema sp. JU1783]|nr:unnamed protein product [Auanema sp. JU1783]